MQSKHRCVQASHLQWKQAKQQQPLPADAAFYCPAGAVCADTDLPVCSAMLAAPASKQVQRQHWKASPGGMCCRKSAMLVCSLAAPTSTKTEWLSRCDTQAKPEGRIKQPLEPPALPQRNWISTAAGIQFLPSSPSDLADAAVAHSLVITRIYNTQSITNHSSSSVAD